MIWAKLFFKAGLSAHWKSLKEILIVSAFATSPLTLGALIIYYYPPKGLDYFPALKAMVSNGELFLYCMSVVGSIIWIAVKDWSFDRNPERSVKHFPPRWFFIVPSALAFGICVTLYAFNQTTNGVYAAPATPLSEALYCASLIMWHIINVISEAKPPNVEERFSKSTSSLMEKLRALRVKNGS